jgi:glycosyltransferase involved in cell wall biosynthesis
MNSTAESPNIVTVREIDPQAPPADVALVVGTFEGGGAERIQINLAEYFLSKGLEVDFVVCRNTGPLAQLIPNGVRIVSLEAGRVLFGLSRYLEYLRAARPRAVLSSVENANIVACFGKRMSRHDHKLYIRIDNLLVQGRSIWRELPRWWRLLLVAAAYGAATGIIAITGDIRKQLKALLWIGHQRILLMYNPVITSRFEALSLEEAPLLSGMDPDRKTVIAVGRLHRQKDFRTLLKAFGLVRQAYDSQLLILGEGPERDALRAEAEVLGISDRVHMPGFIANPLPYVRNASVYVMSSAWEGLPGALIEALATGTPVVCTDCSSGPREILADGAFGALVPVGDASELSQEILEALRSPHKGVSEALAMHLKNFGLAQAGDQYLKLVAYGAGSQKL